MHEYLLVLLDLDPAKVIVTDNKDLWPKLIAGDK